MKLEQLSVGARVRYVPNHAHGDTSHADCEDGVVTSWKQADSFHERSPVVAVFVRYGAQPNSKATSLEDLVQL